MGDTSTMGCGASTGQTQPPPSPTGISGGIKDLAVDGAMPLTPEKPVKAFLAAPAADEGLLVPGAIADGADEVERFKASPSHSPSQLIAPPPREAPATEPKVESRPSSSSSRPSAPLKSRPGSAGGRPSSAERARPSTGDAAQKRPSSAEKNRDGAVQPSVWLENMSRESKTGTRSFIECTPTGQKPERPSSADRKRKEQKKKSKKKNADDRPSSAERNRDDKINGTVWLEGQNRAKDNNGDERPSSAGKRRSRADDDNKLDQNGKPMPNLAPLRGTPLKPILRPGKAAEI